MSGDDYDWSTYESGPFCRHWYDSDCPKKCAACGHACIQHYFGDGDTDCGERDCECEAWVEPS